MDELFVKIKIADRIYPMRVPSEEERHVRQAGKRINEKLHAYRQKFGIHDKQDLLAMAAFDCLSEQLRTEESVQQLFKQLTDQARKIDRLLVQILEA